MKRLFVAGVFSLSFVGQSALAAELRAPRVTPPPAVKQTFNWSGFYAGADLGSAQSKIGIFVPAVADAGTATAAPHSVSFGAHLGYRYQFDSALVIGAEADWASMKNSSFGAFTNFPAQGLHAETKWNASLRGIAGFALGRTLVYGTAGRSWLSGNGCGVSTKTSSTCIQGTATSRVVQNWILGAGLAYALMDNVIVRAEYRHADYGTFRYTGAHITGGNADISTKSDEVRLGVSWKFGGP